MILLKKNFDLFFDELCRKYYEKVLKYIYFSIKDETSARDITQEVFLIVYEKSSCILSHPNIGGFIFQTAKNLVKKHKRELYNKLITEINNDNISYIADNTYDILDTIDKKINEFDFISDIIDMLTEDKKKLYIMYYIKNKTMEEIAKELGISYSAVRMRYVRLRKEIKALVQEFAEENFY